LNAPSVALPLEYLRTTEDPSSLLSGVSKQQLEFCPAPGATFRTPFEQRPLHCTEMRIALHSYAVVTRVFDGQTEGLIRDDILNNITF
jgi:hypothetical protein